MRCVTIYRYNISYARIALLGTQSGKKPMKMR